MTKNERIKQSIIETKQRRQSQALKVIELKVNCRHTSKENFAKLNSLFIEAKWIVNDVLASEDIFKYNYKEHRRITNFDKAKNQVERNLTINTGIHQTLIAKIQQDIVNLSKKKKKGQKVGRLKFKRQINSIPLRTGSFRIKNSKTLVIPHFRNLKVYGLDQLEAFSNYEVANASLIKKASGFYIKLTVFIPKENQQRNLTGKSVGLDFGIKDNITTSDGEKFNCSVQESEKLKFLQRKLSKKQKNSKRYCKLRNQIQKEYEHLTNKKNDDSNKLISYLLKTYDVIYFQDEQISSWRKFNKNFAKNIQHSYLGRIKAKLVELQNSGRSFEISKWSPSTKYCPQCGSLNDGVRLSDRTFKCDCGYKFDRDVHAAKNVKKFGTLKRTECLEQTSAELLISASDLTFVKSQASQDVEAKNKKLKSLLDSQ